jgi:hypothetical protein
VCTLRRGKEVVFAALNDGACFASASGLQVGQKTAYKENYGPILGVENRPIRSKNAHLWDVSF